MVEAEFAAMVAQFGAAGLVGWMWLAERRSAGARERQLTAAHERIMEQHTRLEVLVSAVEANTRALATLEVGQRRVIELLRSFAAGAGRDGEQVRPQAMEHRRHGAARAGRRRGGRGTGWGLRWGNFPRAGDGREADGGGGSVGGSEGSAGASGAD